MPIMVTNTRKLLVPELPTTGTEAQVQMGAYARVGYAHAAGELLYVQDRYLAVGVHTHPVELPPSPRDLQPLFYDGEHKAAATAAWVITESGSWMVFRGAHTPEWSEEDCVAKTNIWNAMLDKRISRNLCHGMSQGQILDVNFKAQTAFLRQASEKYDLQVFAGIKDSAELTRLYA